MNQVKLPRINATTPEGKIAQLVNFMYVFVREHNMQVQELERQIQELKGDNNGNL